MLSYSINRLLSELKEKKEEWLAWDSITVLKNHQLIREYLLDMFQKVLYVRFDHWLPVS
jgi:hypothetical protein